MTGYGRAEMSVEDNNFVAETKSVNHRNIDIIVRLPNILNPLEIEIKKKVAEQIARGRVEINIRTDLDINRKDIENVEINFPLVRNYFSLLYQMKQELSLTDDVTLDILSNFRDVFIYPESDVNLDEIWKQLEGVLNSALTALVEMRQREGKILYKDFIERLTTMRNYLNDVKARAPQVVQEYRERLSTRIAELSEMLEIDEARMNQEIAIMADKSDITEEIVRFESHMSQFEDMLKAQGAIGRKMDFLLQEMVREINTIGSKSNDLEISNAVIEIKTELAKLREQAQNVE